MKLPKSKKLAKFVSALIVFFGALTLAVLMEFLPWFAQLERATYDFVLKVSPHLPPSPQVALVSLDESSQKELGPLPWPRSTMAKLLRKIKEGGGKIAVFDVLYDLPARKPDGSPDPESDQDFAQAIREFGHVVLGRQLDIMSDPQVSLVQTIEPLDIFYDAGARSGYVFTLPDEDTKIRRACWLVQGEPTLATQALHLLTGASLRQEEQRILLGDLELPTVLYSGYPTFLINFAGPSRTIPTRSAYQVLDGTIPRGFLKDKVVFIGADLAAENKTGGPAVDRFPTPVDEDTLMPGVEIHANALNTILNQSFIRVASLKVIWTLLVLIALLTTFYTNALRPLTAGFATVATCIVAAIAVFYIFNHYNYWLPSVRPIALVALVYSGNTLAQYRLAVQERAQIQKAFKHYVSGEVLNELMKNPENLGLGGREVEATVLFTDIAGFSKISEKITPQELTQMLNQYFELLATVIMKEGGMVNKFIGDAVMAIWGVPLENPNHAIQACRASLQMHRAMLSMDPIKCRIGINTGRMIAGNMGSHERFEYTVIGDAVNLASRLEGVNKPYKTDVMISEMTEEKVRGHFLLREVDSIRVIGKLKPVRIYQLLDIMENKEAVEHQRWTEMIDSFLPALEAYKTRQWDIATQLFEQHGIFFPEDAVAHIYLDRCRAFQASPPADDWDGVYQMETK